MNDTGKIILSTIVTIALAFVGYLVTYFNSIRLAQRGERLARVNKQLGELYGPLYSLVHASHMAWLAFRGEYRPGRSFFGQGTAPTEEELKAWRLWMTTVFMPNHSRMYELILTKSDLLIEADIPECLLELCAHVASYQPVKKKWESGDFSEHTALLNYPAQPLLEYTRKSFQQLKREQEELIGHKSNS